MNTKTSNKRKSVAKATTTPNKIPKLISTPVFQKNSKSPKSANKINTKEVNGNKGTKSSKINQRKKTNGAKITHKGNKIKQDDEDESGVSDELNNSDISNDASDSDNEDVQIGNAVSDEAEADSDDEADSDNEDAQIGNAISDDEAEIEQADSDESVVDQEADSNENAGNDNEADLEENKGEAINTRDFPVFVRGLTTISEITLFFHDCNILHTLIKRNKRTQVPTGASYVHFKDEESYKKALEKDGKEVNGCIITVRRKDEITNFSVLVKGVCSTTGNTDLFKNCKICFKFVFPKPYEGRAYLSFEDKESLERALENNLKEIEGRIIMVEPVERSEIETELKRFSESFCVFVTGIKSELELKNIFKNFKLCSYRMINTPLTKGAIVAFENEESLQKALLLHNKKYGDCVLKITRKYLRVHVENINSESDIKAIFKNCNIESIEMKNKSAVVDFKDRESFRRALWKNNTEFGDKTIKVIKVEAEHAISANHSNSAKSEHSTPPKKIFNKPVMKKNLSQKELLLQQLKDQAQHLEREINKSSKPYFKKRYNY